MKKLLGTILMLPFLAWLGTRIVAEVQFDRLCGDHLKRAADANTVDLAATELQVATDYMRAHEMTQGYTNLLWTTPDCDMGFWYKNISQSLEELRAVKPETSMLERTNILLKLRETLLDHGERGKEGVTEPGGISVAPHNVAFAWWGWVGLLVGLVGAVVFIAGAAENQ